MTNVDLIKVTNITPVGKHTLVNTQTDDGIERVR